MMTETEDQAQARPFVLHVPSGNMLTNLEELDLARRALAKNPESNQLRLHLAHLLVLLDKFEEVIGLLQSWNVEEPRFLYLLADALLSRETRDDDLAVKDLCERGLAASTNDMERTRALATLAKVQLRLGEFDEARTNLREALRIYPSNKDAYKRAARLALLQNDPGKVLEYSDELAEEGILHSRMIASQSLALAQLGLMDEARAMQGLDEFLAQIEPEPPAGWDTLDAFNRDLAEEIGSHPDMRYDRYGAASAHTWRVDKPGLKRSRMMPVLQKLIQREVAAYVARLPVGDHPFLRGQPDEAALQNWCVITEGDGHETWHVHQNGWLSGVYYIHVQDHIANGTERDGCISFGLPDEVLGEERSLEFGETICRPRTGLMMMFPSHTYHRTYPHHGDGRRICYAFDVVPSVQE